MGPIVSYKLTNLNDGVIAIDAEGNKLWIPNAPGNRHWDAYQEWLAVPNTPTPADD